MQESGRFVHMQDNEISQESILKTVKKVLENPIPKVDLNFETKDKKIALQRILEGLARKASSGEPAAAKELREWMNIKL
jgi:hypothetical protein